MIVYDFPDPPRPSKELTQAVVDYLRIIGRLRSHAHTAQYRHRSVGEALSNLDIALEREALATPDWRWHVEVDGTLVCSYDHIVLDEGIGGFPTCVVETHPLAPPKGARALERLLPVSIRSSFVGDLQEEFSEVVRDFGLQFAHRWYWLQLFYGITAMLFTGLAWMHKHFISKK